MEYLVNNLDWLKEQLAPLQKGGALRTCACYVTCWNDANLVFIQGIRLFCSIHSLLAQAFTAMQAV